MHMYAYVWANLSSFHSPKYEIAQPDVENSFGFLPSVDALITLIYISSWAFRDKT